MLGHVSRSTVRLEYVLRSLCTRFYLTLPHAQIRRRLCSYLTRWYDRDNLGTIQLLNIFAAFAIYDHLLTLPEEVALVWTRKFTIVSLIFVLNRYMTLAKMILLFQTTWANSSQVRLSPHDVHSN